MRRTSAASTTAFAPLSDDEAAEFEMGLGSGRAASDVRCLGAAMCQYVGVAPRRQLSSNFLLGLEASTTACVFVFFRFFPVFFGDLRYVEILSSYFEF